MRSILLTSSVVLAACGPSVMVQRPASPRVDHALTSMWSSEIRRVAQDGDWLLVRSYANAGDWVVRLTGGEEISHAAIYDKQHDTVIEALTPRVQEISLERFVDRNRYVIVVRPPGTAEQRANALPRARAMVGTGFDLRGMLGFDRPDRFYCSELVYWASNTAARDPDSHWIIAPNLLIDYGQVVYWSGRRDDPQLARAAEGWIDEHRPVRVGAR